MKNLFKNTPLSLKGESLSREECCRICQEKKGIRIGIADYWDIKTCNIVRCEKCNHIQLDPMLTEEDTNRGCYAYYIEESQRTSEKEQFKNCIRNFRRGVVFGWMLKSRRISPRNILELGPGSGYFAAGLQFVIPNVQVTVMDINKEVLDFNKEHHHFETIRSIPDILQTTYQDKFDLVIARDILEHVTDITKVFENVYAYLKPGGLFHFITPNGYEDVWKHYLTFKLKGVPSELLINHVNYFDGKGLKNLLIQKGFSPVDYYTHTLKTTFRGQGRKENLKLMSRVSQKMSAALYVERKADELKRIEFRKSEILNKWYIRPNAKWITCLYSLSHHFSVIRISPVRNIGHEIYGVFEKNLAN